MKSIKVPTLSELAYQSIKDQILSCRIRPGEKINVDRYSEELGVSATPVREALAKLQQEGLIQYVPRTGWKMAKISSVKYRKYKEIQDLLEVSLSCRSLPYIKEEDLAKLERLNDKMKDIVDASPDGMPNAERILNANDDFHMQIFNLYPNNIMVDILQQIWNNLLFVRLTLVTSEEFLATYYDEHIEIIEALKKGDPAVVKEKMMGHLQSGKGYIESYIEEDE